MKKKQYSKEFKEEAVFQVTSGKRTATEVAGSLGVSQSVMSRWLRAARDEGAEAFRGQGNRTASEEEIWALKLDVKRLTQELEFLKKVSRYFAKDQE